MGKECVLGMHMLPGCLFPSLIEENQFDVNVLGNDGGTGENLEQALFRSGFSAATIRNERTIASFNVSADMPGNVDSYAYDACGNLRVLFTGEAVCDWNREVSEGKKNQSHSLFREKRAAVAARWKVRCKVSQGSRALELRSGTNNPKAEMAQEVTC